MHSKVRIATDQLILAPARARRRSVILNFDYQKAAPVRIEITHLIGHLGKAEKWRNTARRKNLETFQAVTRFGTKSHRNGTKSIRKELGAIDVLVSLF
jgi:hypothetical protein